MQATVGTDDKIKGVTLLVRLPILWQDWAMKYLPRKYRESQKDWFGKRGFPWHITVATRKGVTGDVEMLTLVHILPSCSQDNCAVLAVMADVIKQLKSIMPGLKSVFYRQDNAGCYHCGPIIASARVLGLQHGVTVKGLDFSDPQGGKGPCDRKAATIKSHMRIHLNSGNDIETAEQMKDAMLSSGGIPGVDVTLCKIGEAPKMQSLKIEGISFLNNFRYESKGIRVWKAYGIGPGKLLSFKNLRNPSPNELPVLDVVCSSRNNFLAVKQRKSAPPAKDDQDGTPAPANVPQEQPTNAPDVFTCPEEGCNQTFLRHSSLQRHLDCEKHSRVLERETLLDKAVLSYAEALEGQAVSIPEVGATEGKEMTPVVDCAADLAMGWALKSSSKKARFSKKQKDYLIGKFQIGEKTGQKADPSSVARAMLTARNVNGERTFTSEEFLTSSQVMSFFSRLAAKKRLSEEGNDEDDEDFDDLENAAMEAHIELLTNEVARELVPQHPIMYETYNLCDIISRSQLKKFNISVLKEICDSLMIDATDVSAKRKQPYIEKIEEFCTGCTCCG